MRLLHFDGERLILTDFCGKTIPPYAILSHRWGDSEVLFEDLGKRDYKEKGGYRKIKFCAEQAAQDQLQYFWIDTCCIDKWDLRERSKAIKSMFHWYKNAARCYVFLPDVSIVTDAPPSAWEASFCASEWFTRGWTLQELIAPVSVEFFSYEGRRLGDKESLEPLVHEVTNIPLKALRNSPLDEFTIEERKDWARNRETSEEEDKVYCLLGILNVVIPVAYGEGIEKAWRRLQIELETTGSAPFIIPFSQNDRFVGRESQLTELEAMLFGKRRATTMAIIGPAGTGKSQLALEVAHRTRQRDKNRSVFWIDASDIDSLHLSYASIAQKLDIPNWDDNKADSRQLVKAYLSRKGERQYLLVFDNTDNVNLESSGMSTGATYLTDYLPQSEWCSIIYTTTNSDIAKRLAAPNVVKLKEMTLSMAQKMLENHIQSPLLRSEQQEAQLLLHELSYLPLAIVQATAYINTRNITIQEYRSKVERQREAVLKRSSEEDGSQEYNRIGPMTTTLLISLDQIRGDGGLAVDYLFLAACVDRKDIPLDLLPASSPREREEAISVLSSYGLITRRPAESSLELHQLVHRALRKWLEEQGQLNQSTQSAIVQLSRVFPDHSHGSRKKTSLVQKYAMALNSDGRYNESEELFTQVVRIRKRILGNEHSDTLISMAGLASTYRSQGRWKKAEELGVEVMETRKRALGDEHPHTLTSMGNLALTYSKQGRWKKAEELGVKVMETQRRVLGDEHPALTYSEQKMWEKAEELGIQVTETSSRILGNEHSDTLTSMGNLALTYWSQGKWNEAEELGIQIIETSSRVLGNEHRDTLARKSNLAVTYTSQGRYKEAEELFLQVIKISSKVLGVEHPNTLGSMTGLALTYKSQGKWIEAEELGVQVVEASSRVLGNKHPSTLMGMSNLVAAYWSQRKWREAEELGVQVVEMRKRVLGNQHQDTLRSMSILMATYWSQEKWREAEELGVQVMEIRKRVFGNQHRDTLESMSNLAVAYWSQRKWREAEELGVQVMEMRKRVLGNRHQDTLTSMANLAFILKDQGLTSKAISQMENCYKLRAEILGSQHVSTVSSRETLTTWRLEVTELSEQNNT
ncbi:hypothetical protein N0V90_002077 [Kalmusia sp. IMI 367209]|nr:hypothetical protein N0V90_002077 [Kalmusia sp. IMI 367209]